MKRRTVCDIRELATVRELHAWAHEHGTSVTYAGPDESDRPVYVARVGVTERVARGRTPDPRPLPLGRRGPLEPDTAHLDALVDAVGRATAGPAQRVLWDPLNSPHG